MSDYSKSHLVDHICGLCEEFTLDEVRVVLAITERIKRGRLNYGPLILSSDHRDMRREASEEAMDMAVYLACQLTKEHS